MLHSHKIPGKESSSEPVPTGWGMPGYPFLHEEPAKGEVGEHGKRNVKSKVWCLDLFQQLDTARKWLCFLPECTWPTLGLACKICAIRTGFPRYDRWRKRIINACKGWYLMQQCLKTQCWPPYKSWGPGISAAARSQTTIWLAISFEWMMLSFSSFVNLTQMIGGFQAAQP